MYDRGKSHGRENAGDGGWGINWWLMEGGGWKGWHGWLKEH